MSERSKYVKETEKTQIGYIVRKYIPSNVQKIVQPARMDNNDMQ